MAEAYAGLVGAYGYALRRSRSWLLRTYVVASAAAGLYIALLLVLAAITWLATPVAFGERMLLGVIGILLLVPIATPVLVVARRHRRADPDPAADRWLGLAGYGFLLSVVAALFVSDPSPTATQAAFGPAAAWVDRLPDHYGLIPPAVAGAAVAVVIRLTRPTAH